MLLYVAHHEDPALMGILDLVCRFPDGEGLAPFRPLPQDMQERLELDTRPVDLAAVSGGLPVQIMGDMNTAGNYGTVIRHIDGI